MASEKTIRIPQSGPVNTEIRIPGSKSITNRAMIVAALADGQSRLKNLLHSVDTHVMIEAWKKLGVDCIQDGDDLIVKGTGGNLNPVQEDLYIENAGTAVRFLTSVLNLGQGEYVITGNERMQERPIKDLLDALGQMGCKVKDLNGTGCPPVKIEAEGIPGGEVRIPGDKSSQYISSVMLAAPYAKKDVDIYIEGSLVSITYVEMTKRLMETFGIQTEWRASNHIRILANQKYNALEYDVEGDASSASYFFGLAAVTGGKVKVKGVHPKSTQGDLGLVQILKNMGCEVDWDADGVTVTGGKLRAVEVDMNTMSDVAPTLAVIALFAEGTTRITNVANMRIKECDRISAVVTELKKLGAEVEEWEDGLAVTGMGNYHGALMDTYDDHRMAMSLSLAGLKIPEVIINDPDCVKKTFPDYFERFFECLADA